MGALCTKGAPLHRVTCRVVFQLQSGNPSSELSPRLHPFPVDLRERMMLMHQESSLGHYEIWEYCQSTSEVQA